jgi:hypothetical protein
LPQSRGQRLGEPFPSPLVRHTNAATAYEFFDVVDEEAVCGDRDIVGFEDSAELSGVSEACVAGEFRA